ARIGVRQPRQHDRGHDGLVRDRRAYPAVQADRVAGTLTMKFLWKFLLLLALLAAAPFVVLSPFLTHIGVMIGIYTTLALSMNLMLRIGQISFAHGAFMGLGAYGSALLMMRLDLPFAISFFSAALGVTLLAGLVGLVFLRIRGVYFVLLTFAFGEIIVLTFVEWVSLFGG